MTGHPLPGDVILYPANGRSALSSRLVAAGEILAGFGKGLKQYSHAAIVAESIGYQYEATFPRTCYSMIDVARGYEVWRVGEPTKEQRQRILIWCREHVGDFYNLTGVLTAGLIRLPNTYYCSQFAGLSWRAAGYKIGDKIMSPDSIPDTPRAHCVARYAPSRRRR